MILLVVHIHITLGLFTALLLQTCRLLKYKEAYIENESTTHDLEYMGLRVRASCALIGLWSQRQELHVQLATSDVFQDFEGECLLHGPIRS